MVINKYFLLRIVEIKMDMRNRNEYIYFDNRFPDAIVLIDYVNYNPQDVERKIRMELPCGIISLDAEFNPQIKYYVMRLYYHTDDCNIGCYVLNLLTIDGVNGVAGKSHEITNP